MSDQALARRIDKIQQVYDLNDILARPATQTPIIANYYKKNRLAYKFFNSHKGFVHMGISDNGSFSAVDFYKQADLVSDVIKKEKVKYALELAPGKAATLLHLARKHGSVNFYGIDLPKGQLDVKAGYKQKNLELIYGDFHNLNRYEDSSMDIVYVIEALCHAKSKKQVIAEVHRVLRPGGHFVVIDGYFTKPLSQYSAIQQTAVRLAAKSMMVTDKGQSYGEFRDELQAGSFVIEASRDYSKQILPSLYRLESKAAKFFKIPTLGKLIDKIVGPTVAANAIAGYLMPLCVEDKLFSYHYTLARKV